VFVIADVIDGGSFPRPEPRHPRPVRGDGGVQDSPVRPEGQGVDNAEAKDGSDDVIAACFRGQGHMTQPRCTSAILFHHVWDGVCWLQPWVAGQRVCFAQPAGQAAKRTARRVDRQPNSRQTRPLGTRPASQPASQPANRPASQSADAQASSQKSKPQFLLNRWTL
jgi:hypothetical protein